MQPWSKLSYQRFVASQFRNLHHTSSNRVKNHYETLGLLRTATSAEIKTAYYEKAKSYHPDTNKSSDGVKKFQEISEAYEVLSDKAKRRAYDSLTTEDNIYNQYVRQTKQAQSTSRPRSPSQDPISMAHIRHVYQTLNKEEVEEPKFGPFEDHNYKGTSFNRFEYSRQWNAVDRVWVYQKRKTAEEYNKKMAAKGKKLMVT